MSSQSLLLKRSILIGLAVLLASFGLFKLLSGLAKKAPVNTSFKTINVLVKSTENKEVPLQITLSGKLEARNRIDIFSEVTGVLQSKNFREGNTYSKGQVIAQLDDSELKASIQSQISVLLNSLSQVMPDLKMDYKGEFETWTTFHNSIDFNKKLPELPSTSNDQLRLFLSSRNVFTNYYNVKSLESRLDKSTIRSPFGGVLSSADVSSGALVRPGQKLGTLIEPGSYELEASASIDDLRYIAAGDQVVLTSSEMKSTWKGSILRINRSMDPTTQMVRVYIGVSGRQLHEGQYLVANIQGVTLNDVCEVSRQLLLEGDRIYIVQNDSILTSKKVEVVYRGIENVYLKNLPPGTSMLNQVVSNAYEGMIVNILTNN